MDPSSTIQGPEPDLRVRTYLARWWQSFVHLDGPAWRSLHALTVCPGRLAVAHFETGAVQTGAVQTGAVQTGAVRFVHPVRLYLILNVVFFFLSPLLSDANVSLWSTNHAGTLEMQPALQPYFDRGLEDSGLEAELYGKLFDERMTSRQGVWVWVMIPVLAFGSFAVTFRRRRYFVEHLVFATHMVSFALVSLLILGLLTKIGKWITGGTDAYLIYALVLVIGWLCVVPIIGYRSVKAFFGFKWRISTFTMSGWVAAISLLAVWIYLQVLFFATLISMRGLDLAA